MTSIITAWLVKLATRILRDKLAALNDDTERLLLRLEARTVLVDKLEADLAERERLNQHREKQTRWLMDQVNQLTNQVTEYKDNNQILGDQVENLRTENEVLRRQLENQAATINTLQANVSGWSRLFATIEHQVGVSKRTADRLREERDRFTLRTPLTPESREDDAPSGRVEASDFLNSIKPGDSLRITDKAKVYFGNDREWFVVREVCNGYHLDIPRFRVDGPEGDWHPFWFGLTDEDGLYLLPSAKERVNVYAVQSHSTTGAGSASKASDLFTGSKFDGTTDIG